MNIRTVNLVWENKVRGSYPVGPFALEEDGTLTRAQPRPLDTRAYDVTRVAPDGTAAPQSFFSGETLRKLDCAMQGDAALGMTADDLYIFRDGGKTRFLADRNLTFIDAALNANGRAFATVYSDRTGENFALACGDTHGRVAWIREFEAALSAAAISRDGRQIVCGAENGMIWRISSNNHEQWRFEQPEAIRALAVSEDGTVAAYGTASGTVGWIDHEGVRRWEMRLPGEIIALALSATGELCAALVALPDNTGTKLFCLVGNGQIDWEWHSEKRLLRVAVSPDGGYLAVGSRDGTAVLYSVVQGEGGTRNAAGDDEISRAFEAADRFCTTGDFLSGYKVLRAALIAHPTDVALAGDTAHRLDHILEWTFAQAQSAREKGDYAGAESAILRLLDVEPHEPQMTALRATLRQEHVRHLLQQAHNEMQAGQADAAEKSLLEALAVDPFSEAARRELGAIRAAGTAALDTDAERLLAAGQMEPGIAALEKAQAVAPTPQRTAKLHHARTAAEFAAGMTHYNAKNYEQAVFQFRKVLAREPAHAEAKRYLNFAQSFAQNADTDTVADRFAHLE